MGKSWKTTVCGVLSLGVIGISVAKSILSGATVDWGTIVPAFMAGLTGLLAKDHDVTGGAGAKVQKRQQGAGGKPHLPPTGTAWRTTQTARAA